MAVTRGGTSVCQQDSRDDLRIDTMCRMRTPAIIALAVSAVVLSACSGDSDPEPSGDTEAESAGVEVDSGAEDAGDDAGGTWDDPLPAGTPVSMEGWEVVIDHARVMTEGPDPDMPEYAAPDDGMVNVLVHVQATRTGDDPAKIPTMGEGFTLSLTKDGTEVGEGLSVTLDDSIATGNVGPGATVEGWMFVRSNVPQGDVEGSAVTVKPFVAHPETYYVELPATASSDP